LGAVGSLTPAFLSSFSSFLPFSALTALVALSNTFSATLIPSFLASAAPITYVIPPAFSLSFNDYAMGSSVSSSTFVDFFTKVVVELPPVFG
jgi:hypothetical protein